MGVEQIKRFTCDRCQKREECDQITAPKQPLNWSRVVVGEPVLANPFDTQSPRDMMLCYGCSEGLSTFLGGGQGDAIPDV